VLGDILSKKEKPKPVVSEPWFEAKTELYLLAAKVGGSGGGRKPPGGGPPIGLSPEDFNGKQIRIDPMSFVWVGDEIIFKVTLYSDDPQRKADAWVRVSSTKKPVPDRGIDEYLKDALQSIREGGARIEKKVKQAEEVQADAYKQAKAAEEAETAAKEKEEVAKELRMKAEKAEETQKEEAERRAKEAAKDAEEAKKQHDEAEKKALELDKKLKESFKEVKEAREAEMRSKPADAPVAQVSPTTVARFAASKEEALAMPARRN
jgi:hypothetical protein